MQAINQKWAPTHKNLIYCFQGYRKYGTWSLVALIQITGRNLHKTQFITKIRDINTQNIIQLIIIYNCPH